MNVYMGWRRASVSAAVLSAVATLAALTGATQRPPPSAPPVANRAIFGVTIDQVDNAPVLAKSLAGLPVRPTARIYFDVRQPPQSYAGALGRIHPVSNVMGEILDSSDETAISTTALRARVSSYLHALGDKVDIWEVGNEVNGNWTGPYPAVASKTIETYRAVAAIHGRSALTLYVNDLAPNHCGDGPRELTPVQFTHRFIPRSMAAGLDYVFLSYYPSQCGGAEPSSAAMASYLRRIHALYPRAELGIGEVGLRSPAGNSNVSRARQIMAWAYSLNPGLPYYVGGYFWWYAAEDALRPGAPLKPALADAFRSEARALRS